MYKHNYEINKIYGNVVKFLGIERVERNNKFTNMFKWICVECGEIHFTEFSKFPKLIHNHINFNYKRCRSCSSNLIDVGDVIGHTVIISEPYYDDNNYKVVDYLCECGYKGSSRVTDIFNRKIGIVSSANTRCRNCSPMLSTHIHYSRAGLIRDRCEKETHKSYKDYKGRGIKNLLGNTVKEIVLSLDKVPNYFEGAQLDRIDNDGHYTLTHPIHGDKIWIDEYGNKCLGNLRWVTQNINSTNTRVSVTLESLKNKPRTSCIFKKILSKERSILLGWKEEDFVREFHSYKRRPNGINKIRYTYTHKTLIEV